MSARSILSRWQTEYYAPVVVTVCTADVERICLENGLLFHELLSAFGHLDSVNGSIRTGGQVFPISEANIRFERISEVVHKSSGVVEEHLREYFEEYDLKRLPIGPSDLRVSPPTAWTPKIEQLLMHSISFSEFEMASHPLVFLTVVSTTDEDPMACVRELSSAHHMPPCFFTGQYDLDIQRVYVLVHDNSTTKTVDINKLLTKVQAAMAPASVHLMHLNSLPVDAPNLQQPDLWSGCMHPLFFPQHAPYQTTGAQSILLLIRSASPIRTLDPVTGRPIKGCRLSLEDFIVLRSFCLTLYTQDIIPALERRLATLSKLVNENRKGVKNVLKSFWRKPRDEGVAMKGQAKYRCDRSEAQILLLADTSFAIKDYETASAMYRLVRDDFRADKSITHIAHTTVMAAVCQLAGEPPTGYLGTSTAALAAAALRSSGNHREICSHLEILSQCITSLMEPSHSAALYAVIAAELHTSPALVPSIRAPLEAAQILLQAAAALTKLPLLCALVTEKAAEYYIHAGQFRRYAFHEVLAGHKFHTSGLRPKKHAIVCFATAMIIYEVGRWGTVKVKLNRALADELINVGEDPTRALMLLLRVVSQGSGIPRGIDSKGADVTSRTTAQEIVAALKDLCVAGPWGKVCVSDGWKGKTVRQQLLGEKPLEPIVVDGRPSQVDGFPVPEVLRAVTEILLPLNGSKLVVGTKSELDKQAIVTSLSNALTIEKEWLARREGNQSGSTSAATATGQKSRSLAQSLCEEESTGMASKFLGSSVPSPLLQIPLGETMHIQIEVSNRLLTQLVLSEMSLDVIRLVTSSDTSVESSPVEFDLHDDELILSPNTSVKTILTVVPRALGKFRFSSIKWNIGTLCVRQSLQKDGILLQKTLTQRSSRERCENTSLDFEVINPLALLQLQFEGVHAEVLQGEVSLCYLNLYNEGGAAAQNIVLKFSHPFFLVDYAMGSSSALPWLGHSGSGTGTVFELPITTRIIPGQSLKLSLWMRLDGGGLQRLSVLASYGSVDSNANSLLSSSPTRMSISSISVVVIPSLGLSIRCLPRPNKPLQRTIVMDMTSYVNATPDAVPDENNDPDASLVLLDGVFVVDHIRVVGGANVVSSLKSAGNADSSKLEARYMERITVCVPLVLSESVAESSSSWRLSSVMSWYRKPGVHVNSELISVIERLACLSYTAQRHQNELNEVLGKKKVKTSQPALRSIQSVRRENRASSTSLSSMSSSKGGSDVENSQTQQFPRSSTMQQRIASITGSNSTNAVAAMSSPELSEISIEGLADSQSAMTSVAVEVGWLCRWKGRICRGTHFVFGIPLLSHSTSSLTPMSQTTSRMLAADYLSVSLIHVSKLSFSSGCSEETVDDDSSSTKADAHMKDKVALAVVEVELKSMGEQALVAWVDALDWERGQDLDVLSMKKSLTSAEDILAPNSPIQSCRWVGKVRYEAVKIEPYESICLPFIATFNKSGLYDLKSFRITVDFALDSYSTPSVKQIYGQSLIEVVD